MRSRANIKFPEIYEDNNEFGIENGYWQLKGKHREITIGRGGGAFCQNPNCAKRRKKRYLYRILSIYNYLEI